MLAYKAFNRDLTCTKGKGRFQFKENEWIEEPQANCRANGFHAAENPLDCLTYYSDWDRSVYYLVEVDGDIDEDGSDSKISSTRIRLLKRLNVFDFAAAAVEYICHHPERKIVTVDGKIRVKKEKGEAHLFGAVIVYGESPQASGPRGSVLALVKTSHGRVTGVCIRKVDGERCKAGTWYRI